MREPEDWAKGFKNPSKFQACIHDRSKDTPPGEGQNVVVLESIPRRLEDRYQWKKVIEAAETMARNMNPGLER